MCTLLHIATMSGVLSCLLRHFRASLSCLPLLAQPLGCLPLGTWSADSPLVQQHSNGLLRVRARPASTPLADRPQIVLPGSVRLSNLGRAVQT